MPHGAHLRLATSWGRVSYFVVVCEIRFRRADVPSATVFAWSQKKVTQCRFIEVTSVPSLQLRFSIFVSVTALELPSETPLLSGPNQAFQHLASEDPPLYEFPSSSKPLRAGRLLKPHANPSGSFNSAASGEAVPL